MTVSHFDRTMTLHGDVVHVPISATQFAVIDYDDVELVMGRRWGRTRADGPCYAISRMDDDEGKRVNVFMHRLILAPASHCIVDHIDRDPLNNRRSNLRQATHAQNMQNMKASGRGNTHGLKGVWKHGRGYYATIGNGKGRLRIGPFSTKELAHACYAGAASVMYGEFARFELL